MVPILLAWIYGFLMILLIGAGCLKLISRYIGASLNLQYGLFYQFWFGFVIVVGLLQVYSLFLPVSNIAFIPFSLLAVLFAGLNFRSLLVRLTDFFKWLISLKGIITIAAIAVIAVMIAYSANREVLHNDTYLYHFNAVKWAREYPAVPGLANLHDRFGFNSSFFLFAAFTETGSLINHSAHVALSFMLAVCAIQWFVTIFNFNEPKSKRIFCMMTFLFLFLRVMNQIDIASLSTDYPTAILTLVFCLVLLDKLNYKIVLLLPLSAVIFSFKLSGMLAIGIALIFLVGAIYSVKYKIRKSRFELRPALIAFVLLCFLVSGFVIRNVIVSGWLIYPFSIGNLHLPWSMPEPYVKDLIAWIKSYPKVPGGASPSLIAEKGFGFWFPQWFRQFKHSTEFDMLCGSIFVLLWAVFQVGSLKRFIYERLNILLLILFGAAGILFWFVSAPEMRFGSVNFFILFAVSVVLLFEGSQSKDVLIVLVQVLFSCQLVYRLPGYVVNETPKLFTFAPGKPRELKRVLFDAPGEKQEFYFYMPVTGDQCGNSPLPCTPYPGRFIQRKPGDISKGFLPVVHP